MDILGGRPSRRHGQEMPTYPAGLSGGRVEPWAPVQTKPGMGPRGPSEGKKGSLGRERWCAADRPEDMAKDMVSPLSDSAVASKKKPRTIKKGQAFAKPRLTGRQQGMSREEGPRACLEEGGLSAERHPYRMRGDHGPPGRRGTTMGPLAASARAYLLSLSFFSGVRGQMRPATCPPMAPASHGKGYVGYCVSHPVKVLECKANTTTKHCHGRIKRLGQFAQGLGSRSTHTHHMQTQ